MPVRNSNKKTLKKKRGGGSNPSVNPSVNCYDKYSNCRKKIRFLPKAIKIKKCKPILKQCATEKELNEDRTQKVLECGENYYENSKSETQNVFNLTECEIEESQEEKYARNELQVDYIKILTNILGKDKKIDTKDLVDHKYLNNINKELKEIIKNPPINPEKEFKVILQKHIINLKEELKVILKKTPINTGHGNTHKRVVADNDTVSQNSNISNEHIYNTINNNLKEPIYNTIGNLKGNSNNTPYYTPGSIHPNSRSIGPTTYKTTRSNSKYVVMEDVNNPLEPVYASINNLEPMYANPKNKNKNNNNNNNPYAKPEGTEPIYANPNNILNNNNGIKAKPEENYLTIGPAVHNNIYDEPEGIGNGNGKSNNNSRLNNLASKQRFALNKRDTSESESDDESESDWDEEDLENNNNNNNNNNNKKNSPSSKKPPIAPKPSGLKKRNKRVGNQQLQSKIPNLLNQIQTGIKLKPVNEGKNPSSKKNNPIQNALKKRRQVIDPNKNNNNWNNNNNNNNGNRNKESTAVGGSRKKKRTLKKGGLPKKQSKKTRKARK